MGYTQTALDVLRTKAGTLLAKLYTEFGLISTAIGKAELKRVELTAGVGTNTALATSGADLADGTGCQIYGAFVAPSAITVVRITDYLGEAYVKDTDDAKIEVYNDAETPVKIFGRTLDAEGEDAGSYTATTPETGKASVTAGTRLDLKITATKSSSGTGHAKIWLEYYDA